MARHRAPVICSQPGCGNDKPCPEHQPKPWAGSNQRRPDALRGRALQQRNARILRRDHHQCTAQTHAQGCDGTATEVDHVTELADGGTEDDSNLQALNTECHKAKTQAHAAEARRHARGQLNNR